MNIHYKELVMEKSRDQLLTNQLQRLAMCFDVYLETETVNTAREGPVEISREKVFTRVARYFRIFDSFHSRCSKTCLKRPLKIDKIKVLMENDSLMKVESLAECSPSCRDYLNFFKP